MCDSRVVHVRFIVPRRGEISKKIASEDKDYIRTYVIITFTRARILICHAAKIKCNIFYGRIINYNLSSGSNIAV